MSISIITSPDIISPVNDMYGNYFQLSYASFTASNFKYITRLYASDQLDIPTYDLLVQETIPARPITGYGLYSGYQSLLTKLSYTLDQDKTASFQPRNTLLSYFITYGFEYNPNEAITSFAGLGGNTRLSVANPSKFAIGDLINIQTQNADMSGLANVIGFSSGLPVIDKALGTSTVTTGTITDLVHFDGTSSVYYAFNGVRKYGETIANYYHDKYVMGLQSPAILESQSFLTTYPLGIPKKIMSNQYEMIGAFIGSKGFTGSVLGVEGHFYDDRGNLLGSVTVSDAISFNSAIERWDCNLAIPVFLPLYPTSKFIDFTLINYLDVTKSEVRRFEIDRNCSIYPNVRIMWLNTLGAWDYFNFRLVDTKNYNITRNEYKQVLPFNPVTNDYQYTVGARERTTQSLKVVESHTINTDFISEEIYDFLSGILISPEVYRIDESTNLAYPLMITDSKFQFKKAYVDQIMNLTVTYETSYGIETQYQ